MSNKKEKDELISQLDDIIYGLLDSYKKENEKRLRPLSERTENIFCSTSKKEYLDCIIKKYDDLEKAFAAPFHLTGSESEYIMKMIINGTYKHFLSLYIKTHEGRCCQMDKVSLIIRKTINALETGENQSLYETYEGYDQIEKERWNDQAYWSPKSIKDTDEAMNLFKQWYFMTDDNLT